MDICNPLKKKKTDCHMAAQLNFVLSCDTHFNASRLREKATHFALQVGLEFY